MGVAAVHVLDIQRLNDVARGDDPIIFRRETLSDKVMHVWATVKVVSCDMVFVSYVARGVLGLKKWKPELEKLSGILAAVSSLGALRSLIGRPYDIVFGIAEFEGFSKSGFLFLINKIISLVGDISSFMTWGYSVDLFGDWVNKKVGFINVFGFSCGVGFKELGSGVSLIAALPDLVGNGMILKEWWSGNNATELARAHNTKAFLASLAALSDVLKIFGSVIEVVPLKHCKVVAIVISVIASSVLCLKSFCGEYAKKGLEREKILFEHKIEGVLRIIDYAVNESKETLFPGDDVYNDIRIFKKQIRRELTVQKKRNARRFQNMEARMIALEILNNDERYAFLPFVSQQVRRYTQEIMPQ